jgi:rfaE bifunctional protein kinase chain/domain
MLDRYLWGSVARISPEAPVPIVNITNTSVALGGAANVAANVVGFGAKSTLAGVCGADGEAQVLAKLLSTAGINNDLAVLGERPTTVKTRLVAHSQHVVRFDHEISAVLSDEEADQFIEGFLGHLNDASVVVVSDYAKGVICRRVLSFILSAAQEKGIRVLVDPKGKDYSKYKGATILTPNRREAADAANLDESDPRLVEHAGSELLSRCELEAVLITQGEKGMTLFEGTSKPQHLEALARDVYDVTGAGDTVIAAMAVALGAGASFLDAARIANVAAGLAVEEVGTTIISKEKILNQIAVATV